METKTDIYKSRYYWNIAIYRNEKYITTVSVRTKRCAMRFSQDPVWLQEQVEIFSK